MYKLDLDLNTVKVDSFTEAYPAINKAMMDIGDSVTSRNGHTKEFLHFKTILNNPLHRCVGGFNRNINIFFLKLH